MERLIELTILLGILGTIGGSAGYADNPDQTTEQVPSAEVQTPPGNHISFSRDIRPILSNHCFQCHGLDESTRQAGLRLDRLEEALASGAIVPGAPDQSELLHRVLSTNDDLRMPPPEVNKPLSHEQMDKLRQWIAAGAPSEEHWSFRRITRPEIPHTLHDPWCRNEIDAFVLERLQAAGLPPSQEADRTTLIRRLTQDLHGLLPTLEETEAFLSDESPDAYERLVERLLMSPHYGERWGRHWLDQARYADSQGYTIDGERIMWPYRDWVLQAINLDMPFDQFTIEQLAGDLLPNPTLHQRVATGFHRNTMINQEGGVKPDQFRNEALVDRVHTTGAVWLGLTLGCAQCHSHKFDPISHEEFYRLYAFFNQSTDTNNTGATVAVHQGEIFGWSDEQHALLAELQTLNQQAGILKDRLAQIPQPEEVEWNWQLAEYESVRSANNASFLRLEDGSLLTDGNAAENDSYMITFRTSLPSLTAVRLRVLPHESLPENGPGTASNGNFVLTDVELHIDNVPTRFNEAWADHSQPNYPVQDAIDGKPNTGWAINVSDAQAQQGVLMNAPHEAVFALPAPLEISDRRLTLVLRHDLNKNYLVGRFAVDLTETVIPGREEQAELHADLAILNDRMREIESRLPGRGKPVDQMVMQDSPQPKETYLLLRGDFLTPDLELGPLTPGVPHALIPEGVVLSEMSNRLDLARWLVSTDNPLTARVVVNRVWMRYFGEGLVETENDFGYQGAHPSHPELLDWLASELMHRGWSLKELHRTIVTSATYRQSSDYRQDAWSIDPSNRLLARQSRFRVEGEIIRDMALTASGLLNPEIGGPSVYPPQPEGVYAFTQNPKPWPTSTGPDRYRRTMYAAFYRSAPYPLLTTFDAPDFSTVCTRRVRSNTPLQSLALANDPLFVELAAGLARRVLKEVPAAEGNSSRCQRMFACCLTRSPTEVEQSLLLEFVLREQDRFAADPVAAEAFVRGVEVEDEELYSLPELAAWTSLARVLINCDEFVTRN